MRIFNPDRLDNLTSFCVLTYRDYSDGWPLIEDYPLKRRAAEIRAFFVDLMLDGDIPKFDLSQVDWRFIAANCHRQLAA